MLNAVQRHNGEPRAGALNLSAELGCQVSELVYRLENRIFNPRPLNKTRLEDGEIVVSGSASSGPRAVQIRLNAYNYGRSAVLNLVMAEEGLSAAGLMIRDRAMDGDDRGLIAIPQRFMPEDLATADNLIFGACGCIGRGSVLAHVPGESSVKYQLYLPSLTPLPCFGPRFELLGMGSLY